MAVFRISLYPLKDLISIYYNTGRGICQEISFWQNDDLEAIFAWEVWKAEEARWRKCQVPKVPPFDNAPSEADEFEERRDARPRPTKYSPQKSGRVRGT
ncbi:MAG: hypothetical protein MJ070_02830, partial [Lachnospiraceae bacterium]|nr:hypothetical protein [Lachnospiraceae bacterium]